MSMDHHISDAKATVMDSTEPPLIVLRVGGVPEHFNIPFHQAIESGQFRAAGLDVKWTDYKTGTGGMTQALASGEQDVCIVLTEGAVADALTNGSGNRIVGTHVSSPLVWGIHARADNLSIRTVSDVQGKRYAVSRLLSGSHLMATVHAHQQGWCTPIPTERLVIATNIDGARTSMASCESDVFLWEKYTTKYVVDSGEWSRVGEVATPWPCFVVAASQSCLADSAKSEAVQKMMSVVGSQCKKFMANVNDSTVKDVADKCGLSVGDAREWFSTVKVGTAPVVQRKALLDVIHALKAINIISDTDCKAFRAQGAIGTDGSAPDTQVVSTAAAPAQPDTPINDEGLIEQLLASFTSLV